MRILFISPSNAIGGAEMSLLQMAKSLHRQGHSVFVAMPPSVEKRYEELLRPFVEAFLFIPLMAWNRITGRGFFHEMKGWVYRFVRSRGGWFYVPFRIASFVQKHKIQVIHTNTIMSLDGAFAAKLAGVPHIQHLREITGYRPDALFAMLGQKHAGFYKKCMNFLHKTVIVNSQYVARASEEFYPEAKIRLAYNLFDESDLKPKNAPESPRDTFNIGLVANVTARWKNHALLISLAEMLFKENPDAPFHFNMYGKLPADDDSYLRSLKSQIQAAGLQDKVFFKGLMRQDELYEETDILFHSTPREFFGRIFIEAMAKGIPVLAVRGGGADELIEEGKNGFLFGESDLKSAAETLQNLYHDRALYQHIAENGRHFAQQFRSEVRGAELLTIYEEILP